MKTSTPTAFPTVIPDPPVYELIGDTGKLTLWVVFIIMFFSSAAFIVMAFSVPVQKRLFHQVTAFITIFATLSYFAMATGDGISVVGQEVTETHDNGMPDTHHIVYRQVFWARYVDWSVTTPLLLLDLALLAGMNGSNILTAIIADVIMILTGLFAAYSTTSSGKWGWFIMGDVALVVIIYNLFIGARRTASARDASVGQLFNSLAIYTIVLWTAYPIVWGIGDGARKISIDSEVLSYAILDVLAKAVFGFWLLIAHQRIPASHITLNGIWSHGFSSEGHIRVGDDDDA